jgi:anthranilate phosphoribosyltransferase
MILRDLLRVLGSSHRDGRNLSEDEAFRAFSTIFAGTESEIQAGAFLIALRWKGVTVEELTGFARAARERATIPCVGMAGLVCVCPPHDGLEEHPPLEVAAGLIAAAAGARVMIVTDRCVPPKRGLTAASVLEHFGVGLTWDPREVEEWILKARFGAIAAPGMIPSILGLRRVRGDIGVRTPLATVEKLIAPSTAAMVVGAQAGPVLGTAVEVIQALGHPHGIAVQGVGGGVIPSLRRRSRAIEVEGAHIAPLTIDPSDFGLDADRDEELPMYMPSEESQGTGDNPALVKNAGEINRAILAGQPGPARNAALIGAALMLKAVGRCMTLAEGVDAAINALDSGEATAVLERLKTLH